MTPSSDMGQVGGESGASADADRGSRASTEPAARLGPDGLRSPSEEARLPWQVSGVRGRIISDGREYVYHGIGPDGVEIAAVWFDTRTGAGLRDAHYVVTACNAYPELLKALELASWLLADISPDGLVKRHIDAALSRASGTQS